MKFTEFGTHDLPTIEQMDDVASRAVAAALMADGHKGYVMPVGGVTGYDNAVSVVGVGFDIACGNCAIQTNLKLSDISNKHLADIEHNPYSATTDKQLNIIANRIKQHISFGIGRTNLADDAPVDHPLFLDPAWYIIPQNGRYRDEWQDKARKQLGTVGSGNHYVDVFVDRADETIWVGVHFGSRGLGHTIASNFLAIGQGGTWGDRGKEIETLLKLDTPTGSDYWALMELAGKYAYAGREWVTRKVVEILGGQEVQMIHNHHNFAWKEQHKGQELVVVRKGATPAFPGQKGFVGGSMGDDSVILQGAEFKPWPNPGGWEGHKMEANEEIALREKQESALFSTVHGAGRVMSRTEAAGKRNRRTGQLRTDKVTGAVIKRGRVTPQMQQEWLDRKGVILRGGGVDESPHVYRRLPDVLEAQGNTIEILHTLRPLIVCMAGHDEFDPFKD